MTCISISIDLWGQWFAFTRPCGCRTGMLPHLSVISSDYLVASLLATIPSITIVTNCWSIFHICPYSLSFFRLTTVQCLSDFFLRQSCCWLLTFPHSCSSLLYFSQLCIVSICCRKDSKPPLPVTAQSMSPMMMVPAAYGYPGYMPAQPLLHVSSQSSTCYYSFNNYWNGWPWHSKSWKFSVYNWT